jgi:ketosteroid isomerase-like protein
MSRATVRTALPVAVLVALLSVSASPATAQVPGGRPGSELSRFRAGLARVRAEAMVAISRQLAGWQDDWTNDDAGALAGQYADSAHIQLAPGGPMIEGRKAIESTYAALLGHVGSMGLRIRDFDAGENLAFVLGDYRYNDADGRTERGTFVMSLRRAGHDRWRIHSQLFAPTGAAGGVGVGGP